MAERTYSAREIVLEFFPATRKELIPQKNKYKILEADLNSREIFLGDKVVLKLSPIPASGSPNTQICCDICKRMAPRRYFRAFKAEKPNSNGRAFRYYWLCVNLHSCELNRLNEDGLEQILINNDVL